MLRRTLPPLGFALDTLGDCLLNGTIGGGRGKNSLIAVVYIWDSSFYLRSSNEMYTSIFTLRDNNDKKVFNR